ncbi:hypothetical protein [Kineococcus sp. SYSU DK001]|uniref:hypothetical protein n=1 Tax=Kineococcus sp. SYSU DK001 TaxID=3383122 RepID=UPI003D7ECD0C
MTQHPEFDVVGTELAAVELIHAVLVEDRPRQAALLGTDHPGLLARVLAQFAAVLVAGYPDPPAEVENLRRLALGDLERKAQRAGRRAAARLTACPRCGGERLLDHPSGLTIRHRKKCNLGEAELARQAADAEVARSRVGPWQRPTTFSERQLIAAAGVDMADDALVEVTWLTPSLRRRTFTDRTGREVDLDAPAPEDSAP